jgi:hypothetical protein
MKILIVTTKWAAGTLENVYCATHRSLVKPAQELFKNDPDIELSIEYIEKSEIWSAKQLNERLLRNDFDICIYSPFKDIVPTLEVAKKLGKKLFICVWDQLNGATKSRTVNLRLFLKNPYDNGVVKFDHSMCAYADYCNVLVGGNGFGQIFPNINAIFEPMDTSVLYPVAEEEKTYDLAFIGSLYEYERQWYVKKLLDKKYPVHLLGGKGDNEQKLSYEDWAKVNRETRISLNFNGNFALGGLKGRTWEVAACNNLMIATLPEVYKYPNGSWFTEDVHYVSINQGNYLDKIKYYMQNSKERIAIANAMHEHWKNNYTAEIWWNNIFKWSKNV